MTLQSQLIGFWRNEKETVVTSLIIGVIGHLLINKSFSFNKELIAIILVSFLFVAVIKSIVRVVRGDAWAKENYRKNKFWIIILSIVSVILLSGKTNLFAFFDFLKPQVGIGVIAKLIGGALGGWVGAILIGLPAILFGVVAIIAIFMFGTSISKILAFFASNIAIIVIAGAALFLLFIWRRK